MAVREDLAGKKFGKLTVLKFDHRDNSGHCYWKCACDCGNDVVVSASNLKSGQTTSCGCSRIKHGGATRNNRDRLYDVYKEIISRCYNHNNREFNNYGGRGVKVCSEWENDYLAFKEWALNNGYDENADYGKCTIDRIDVNGDYEPDNCRFIDSKTQQNNRTNNVIIEYNNEKHTLAEWAEILGIKYDTLKSRYKRNWSLERIFSTAVDTRKASKKKKDNEDELELNTQK